MSSSHNWAFISGGDGVNISNHHPLGEDKSGDLIGSSAIWEQPTSNSLAMPIPVPNLIMSTRDGAGGGFLQFPTDSAFIQRAARFSCFNSENFSDMVQPFTASQASQQQLPSLNDHLNMAKDVLPGPTTTKKRHSANSESELSGGGGRDDESGLTRSNKRSKTSQDTQINQHKGGVAKTDNRSKGKADQNQTSATSKSSSQPAKEDYIHMRARRGQATNSHSLAERVRREKIGERMKLLQELVPGCNKVTGKAVMLDEIINYVQSLQRQVEFLSMKLATVNPGLDLNIQGILAKDFLQSQGGSSSMGFSPDMSMVHHQLHPSQHGLIQAGIPSMGNPSETLRRTLSSQLAVMNSGYRDLSQASGAWDDELQNVLQLNFGTNGPFSNQELNGSLPPGRTKVEL